MKKPLLLLSMFTAVLVSQAQTVIFEDNFDSYTIDSGVSAQSLVWDTWDGTAGIDGLVSADFAFSGTNSAQINGTGTDLVLPIGPYTSGKYDLKFKMLLTTSGGYFNLLHDWTTTSTAYEWACDVFFGADGTVTWTTGFVNNGSSSVAFNEWFDVQVTADLDADMGYIYLNGVMINSWQWSLNNADGTAGQNVLAAADFYGTNDANGEGLYYIDDVQLVESTGVYTQELDAQLISVYPNPAQNQLTITLPSSTQVANVQICDVQGRVAFTGNINSIRQSLDISSLDAGVYAVRVNCGENTYAQKLIIE